jgi:thiol:disulfide interchange protein DsbD
MKKFLGLLTLLFISTFAVFSQADFKEPVTWETHAEKINDKEYFLVFKAKIEDKWHLYSQYNPEGASLPIEFDSEQKGKLFDFVGKAEESETHKEFSEVWKKEEIFFSKEGTLKQRIILLKDDVKEVELTLYGQACKKSCIQIEKTAIFDLSKAIPAKIVQKEVKLNDNNPIIFTTSVEKINDKEYYLVYKAKIADKWHLYSQYNPEGASLPIEFDSEQKGKDFDFVGKAEESETHKEFSEVWKKEEIFFSNNAILKQKIKLLKDDINKIEVSLFGQVCKKSCIQVEETATFDLTKTTAVTEMKAASKSEKTESNNTKEEKKGLLMLFFGSFIAGLAALLTPCVFPMIPMTVSFFTKQSKSKAQGIRNAIIYGLAIIFIYVVIGLLVSLIFGADALNELSTNPWFNIIFFVLLVVFAISFLGAFEIMLPNSWANKVDSQADRGGIVGILFMALALAIVSFSCTGPLVGSALVAAASTGEYLAPIISMLGFSIAIALPFALFAAFPGWMNSLPKSGGWLNTVKVVLGFLELALAFKFLSNADLVLDTHYLERETFLAIWIAVFGAMAFYLFGKIKLPHDSPLDHISVGRLMLGLVTLTFVIYLIPGLWGAPLKIISGFPPPMNYSESPYGVGSSKGTVLQEELPDGAVYGPHDIPSFEDFEEGLAYAKEVGKPILLDFTGKACVNCRKMEEQVWSDPKVMQILKKDIVLISLFVDFKKKLPKEEQYVSKETGKKIKTIGNKWSDLQMKEYKANAQPYYVIINHDSFTPLNGYASYDPNIEKYIKWLKEGIGAFKK